jgi:hypothetical protein
MRRNSEKTSTDNGRIVKTEFLRNSPTSDISRNAAAKTAIKPGISILSSAISSAVTAIITADDKNHAEKNFSKKQLIKILKTFFSFSIIIHPFFYYEIIISNQLFFFNIKKSGRKLPDFYFSFYF